MTKITRIMFAGALLWAGCRSAAPGPVVIQVRPGASLAELVERASSPTRFLLQPGTYELTARPYRDPSCANCEDPGKGAEATLGLRMSGRGIEIAATPGAAATIVTNAGYGILIEDCDGCAIEGIAVTGGRRDPDGQASDGAIVVRRSRASIRDSVIRDNIGHAETVRMTIVGIIGIVGREGADIVIERNRITRNSWDGIALYRGASAVIRDNVIDGVDKARGDQVGGGRGVAIGMTWDARAVVERNFVTRYWKGIGAFVSARAEIRHNIIEDVITWGISLWDAGKGDAAAAIENNAVYRAGACGASITRRAACERDLCSATNNAFVLTGLNPKYDPPDYYCRQEALAGEAVPAGFEIAGNAFHLNREAAGQPGHEDVPRAAFLRAVQPLVARLRQFPVLARSRFLAEIDRLPDSATAVTPP
jgi:hypothetical protein